MDADCRSFLYPLVTSFLDWQCNLPQSKAFFVSNKLLVLGNTIIFTRVKFIIWLWSKIECIQLFGFFTRVVSVDKIANLSLRMSLASIQFFNHNNSLQLLHSGICLGVDETCHRPIHSFTASISIGVLCVCICMRVRAQPHKQCDRFSCTAVAAELMQMHGVDFAGSANAAGNGTRQSH